MSNLTENQCALRGWTAIVPRHLGSCLPILMTQVAICCQLKLHVCGSWMPECQLSNVTKKWKAKKKKKKNLPQKPWNKIHEYIRGTCDHSFFFFFFFFAILYQKSIHLYEKLVWPSPPNVCPPNQGSLHTGHFAKLSLMKNSWKIDFELDLGTFPVELETSSPSSW